MRCQVIVCICEQHIFELLRGLTRKEQILVRFLCRAGCCIKCAFRNHKHTVVIIVVAALCHGILTISRNGKPQGIIFTLGCCCQCYRCTVDCHRLAAHSEDRIVCSHSIAVLDNRNTKQLFKHISSYKSIITRSLHRFLNINLGIVIIQSAAIGVQGCFVPQKGKRFFIAEHRVFRGCLAIQIARLSAIVDTHIVNTNSAAGAPPVTQYTPDKRILQISA